MADSRSPQSPAPDTGVVNVADFECSLCSDIFYHPITCACGHTFCRGCILRVLDNNPQCPLCRTIIHICDDANVNLVIQNIIQRLFPRQLKTRTACEESTIHKDSFNIPIFIMENVLFPLTKLPLHVFEPRYRLMIRRCLEGSRKFGVLYGSGSDVSTVGTIATIEHHVSLPDGRCLVSTRGGQRFKVLSMSELDGYNVARVEYFRDTDHDLITNFSKSDLLTGAEGSMDITVSTPVPNTSSADPSFPSPSPISSIATLLSITPDRSDSTSPSAKRRRIISSPKKVLLTEEDKKHARESYNLLTTMSTVIKEKVCSSFVALHQLK
mmetsp:Transcript_51997/g.130558  ORF Transcript_51997/g.130558 Transcript_51997/m.130558 type:complete len:325 (-) Transcript_51997:286-1260(-)